MVNKKKLTRREEEDEKTDLMVLRADSLNDEHFETLVSGRDEARRLLEMEGAVDVPDDTVNDLGEWVRAGSEDEAEEVAEYEERIWIFHDRFFCIRNLCYCTVR